MLKRFQNSMNYNPERNESGLYEAGGGESMTIPDQSLTIKQIIDLYTRGKSLDVAFRPAVSYDNPDWDDVDPTLDPTFDIIDAHNLQREIKEREMIRQSRKTPSQIESEARQITIDEATEREAQAKVERSE